MDQAPGHSLHLGLPEGALLPGEVVLRDWNAPHGKGVLTAGRLILFDHRGPVHREVEWAVDLRQIDSIEVIQLDGLPQYGYVGLATYGGMREGGRYYRGTLPGSYDVRVDGVTVYRGTPGASEEIQGWIDAAKAAALGASRSRPLK